MTPKLRQTRRRSPPSQAAGGRTPHSRPSEIETHLSVLSHLSTPELVERVRIEGPADTRYVPTECGCTSWPYPTFGNDEGAIRDLFTILRQRVLQAVPVLERHLPGSSKRRKPPSTWKSGRPCCTSSRRCSAGTERSTRSSSTTTSAGSTGAGEPPGHRPPGRSS